MGSSSLLVTEIPRLVIYRLPCPLVGRMADELSELVNLSYGAHGAGVKRVLHYEVGLGGYDTACHIYVVGNIWAALVKNLCRKR